MPYVAEDVSTFDAAATYTDAAATDLVETLTVTGLGSGQYELSKLTYASYTLGVLFYLKLTFTPTGAAQRSQIYPFYIAPLGQPGGLASVTTTDAEGQHVQPPTLRLRVGSGAFRDADLSNAVKPNAANRYETVFPRSDSGRGKILHLLVYNIRAGEPWAFNAIKFKMKTAGDVRVGQG